MLTEISSPPPAGTRSQFVKPAPARPGDRSSMWPWSRMVGWPVQRAAIARVGGADRPTPRAEAVLFGKRLTPMRSGAPGNRGL
jgi:hypothetical protein